MLRYTLTLAILLLAACNQNESPVSAQPKAKTPPVAVILSPIEWHAEQVKLEAVGTSQALKSVILYPATAGEVTAVRFNAGQKVEIGQTLLELDQRAESLAVELATVSLKDAERLYQRYQRASGNTFAPTVIDEARTAMELRRIELKSAQVALADRTVKAPFSGYIGITDIDVGDRITTSTPIATLDDRSTLIVRFAVPEALYGQLQTGQDITINRWQHRNEHDQGKIIDVDSQINPTTRTFIVRAHVDNQADLLRPGMSFRVQLTVERQRYPTVPEVAVQWGGDGAYLWAVKDGVVQQVSLNIVQRLTGKLLIDADLSPEMQVVVEGVQRMREGAQVTEFKPATQP